MVGSTDDLAAPLGPAERNAGLLVYGGFSFGVNPGPDGCGRLGTVELTMLADQETVISLAVIKDFPRWLVDNRLTIITPIASAIEGDCVLTILVGLDDWYY